MEAIEQSFPLVLFVMLYKMVLALESMEKIVKSDVTTAMKAIEPNSLHCSAIYCAVQVHSIFSVFG